MNYKKKIYIVIMMASLAGGAFLRLENIGKFSFWTDELFAVYAAKSYASDNSFYVPYEGEHPYRKLVVYTTSFMFKHFGESERTARMPFAIANLFFILLSYFLLSRIFSRNVAVTIAFIMAFSPIFIQMSRECRSYTLHQLFYFLSSTAFILGFEYKEKDAIFRAPQIARKFETRYQVNVLLLSASILLGYIAKNLQPLTYNLAFIIGGYAIIMLAIRIIAYRDFERSAIKYAVVVIGIVMGGLLQYIFNHEHFVKMLKWSVSLPDWARFHNYSIHYYRWYLAEQYPVFFFLYPLGLFFLVKDYKQKGIFFGLMFIIPFILHSLVYPLKSDRYIFYAIPYFLLGFGIVADKGISTFKESIANTSIKEKAILNLVLLPLIVFILQPWFPLAMKEPYVNKFPNWLAYDEKLKASIETAKVITTRPIEFLYYFKRKPDYAIVNSIPRNYEYGEDLLDNGNKLMEALKSQKDLYLVAYRRDLNYREFLNEEMKSYIKENMVEIETGYEKSFIVLKKI
jgi:4-amino-4-deoxy-L-arabinose transferase-like glycosyltransferase